MAAAAAAKCALNGTVVASACGPSSCGGLESLARSVHAAGFPCVVALAYEPLALPPSHVLQLPQPMLPLLPRAEWCNRTKNLYERRRVELYRVLLWRALLDAGVDVLGVDPHYELVRDPMPALHSLRARGEGAAAHDPAGAPEVVGHEPGWYLKQFSLSLLYVRSTQATRALIARVEARTFGATPQRTSSGADQCRSKKLVRMGMALE